jgi:DNA-directed RNA polymerase specialized sigma24 family protein
MPGTRVESFTEFVEQVEPRLRIALVARFGPERGREATAEGLAYAWENWELMEQIEFPIAYLCKVGRSRTRLPRRLPATSAISHHDVQLVEPALPTALDQLTAMQRMAVVLVHAYGWTHAEAARVMDVAEPTAKTHVQRGLAKLRASLEVHTDA